MMLWWSIILNTKCEKCDDDEKTTSEWKYKNDEKWKMKKKNENKQKILN